jgi:hypothetical protein
MFRYCLARETASFEVCRQHIFNLRDRTPGHLLKHVFDYSSDSKKRQLTIQKRRDCDFVRGI